MENKFNKIENYFKKNNLIDEIQLFEESSKEKQKEFILEEINSKNSKFNNLVQNLIENNDFLEIEVLGEILNINDISFNFKMQNLKSASVEIIKPYIKHADEETCSSKVNIIKKIIQAEDEEGIDILLGHKFIMPRTIDKYLNFALNSGRYKVIPKLIESKNL